MTGGMENGGCVGGSDVHLQNSFDRKDNFPHSFRDGNLTHNPAFFGDLAEANAGAFTAILNPTACATTSGDLNPNVNPQRHTLHSKYPYVQMRGL